jgi:hypothetical protein
MFCIMTIVFALVYPIGLLYSWFYFPVVCYQKEKTWFGANQTPPPADNPVQLVR